MFQDYLLDVRHTDIYDGPTNVNGNFDTVYFSCGSNKRPDAIWGGIQSSLKVNKTGTMICSVL